ncbi:hypothetical protein [Caenimonas soli]|uniref:hypothetical protein n=1 Tax=Caenimonas soli TaxID=2735555 RepID=UPI001556170C|nr:hypothetical protein [Caenimonas soli]NPC58149.1 hypothetical protein [Caenimonas soli]
MNKKYSKTLYQLFEQELKVHWPHFKRTKRKPDLGRGYVWTFQGVANVFLFLRLDLKGRERFFCDLGWSRIADYPQKDWFDFRFPHLNSKSAFGEAEMIAGIQRLWGDNGVGAWNIPDPVEAFNPLEYSHDPEAGGREFARRVNLQAALTEEDAEKLVRPVVDDLFKRLASDVMPYLLEYLEFTRTQATPSGEV